MSQETVVITGATAGGGGATVEALAERGARIGLLARGEDHLEATKKEVASRVARPQPFPRPRSTGT